MSESFQPKITQTLLETMLDTAAEGICCIDTDCRCTFCNLRGVELFGFQSKDEIVGTDIYELIRCEDPAFSAAENPDVTEFDRLRYGQEIHISDAQFRRKDGESFDVEYWCTPTRKNQRVDGAIITFIDMTSRTAESARQKQLMQLIDNSQDAIIVRDLSGRVTSWNLGAEKMYGYTAEEMLGKSSDILFPEGSQPEIEIDQAIATGNELEQFEVIRRCKDGSEMVLSINISPLYDSRRRLTGTSSIERDISESRRSRSEILQAMTAAERAETIANQANRSRNDFLANVSHELRTPMNAILGMLNLSLEERLDPLVCDYLLTAKTSAQTLLHLVNELLDFSKIESGKFELNEETFDIRDIINATTKILALQASEKGIELLCEVDSEVPAEVIGDPRRLQQVTTNLLSNAVKFTETGEVVLRVSLIRKFSTQVRLKVTVKDTGIGIAPENQKKILLPFAQADMSSTREHHGTGLGLSICRELVSKMGGQLKVNSVLGKGSEFSFELSMPIVKAATAVESLPFEQVKNLRVLIVDDNPTNLRILEKIFVSWSMQPIVCRSAEEAVRVVQHYNQTADRISLAIIDVLMPNVDGFELANELVERFGDDHPPIVMMQSSVDLALFSEQKETAPVAYYLSKPVSQSELLDAVVDSLDLYSHPYQQLNINAVSMSRPPLLQRLHILLVEDLAANRKVAQSILQKRGHVVETANNGRVAIEKIQSAESSFDVVLMDVQMPVMDGYQATSAIRALDDRRSHVPIIAMTAHAMQGDRAKCLAAGMDDYISKPLDADLLIRSVETIGLRPATQNTPQPDAKEAMKNSSTQSDSPSTTHAAVDYNNALKRLGGDESLFREFIEIFQEDGPVLLQNIENAITENNPPEIEKSAHALKGLMSNFGAEDCCHHAQEIETSAKSKQMEDMATNFAKLKDGFKALSAELETYI